MQYTGTAFSAHFVELFRGAFHERRREARPDGPFPKAAAHVGTHWMDAIEHRIFETLGEGEGIAARVTARISEQPRFAFGLGFVALGILLAAIAFGVSR